MICNKCGKEMDNHATVCPGCGSATPNAFDERVSPESILLKSYSEQVNTVFVVAVLSLIFSLGVIGLVAVIANAVLFNKLPKTVNLVTKSDMVIYEHTQKKLRSALILHYVACALSMVSSFAVLFLLF